MVVLVGMVEICALCPMCDRYSTCEQLRAMYCYYCDAFWYYDKNGNFHTHRSDKEFIYSRVNLPHVTITQITPKVNGFDA